MKKPSSHRLSTGVLTGTLAAAVLAPASAFAAVNIFSWLSVTENPRITYARSTGTVTIQDHGTAWIHTVCGTGWYVNRQGYTAGAHSVNYNYSDREGSQTETPTTSIYYLAQAFDEEIEEFCEDHFSGTLTLHNALYSVHSCKSVLGPTYSTSRVADVKVEVTCVNGSRPPPDPGDTIGW